MGTPDFACPTLKKLIDNKEFEILAVYTKEPQIAGRGHKLTNSAIHNLALQHDLSVVTPKTLRDEAIQNQFKNFKADVAVVVAYGLILPEEILNGTKFGCINIHPSKLPRWRGAAPIQRTIMAGDSETALDIIQMDKGLDSGDVIASQLIRLNGDETYASLAPILADLGADLLIEALQKIRDGNGSAIKQDGALATYAKKIEKLECEIIWANEGAVEVERKIRGLNGSLGAYFMHNDEKIKIFTAEIIDENSSEFAAGKILNDKFFIQCKKGVIRPLLLQRQGKNKMRIDDFLRGI
jgi:methionyl-tRNA formyltransferase